MVRRDTVREGRCRLAIDDGRVVVPLDEGAEDGGLVVLKPSTWVARARRLLLAEYWPDRSQKEVLETEERMGNKSQILTDWPWYVKRLNAR